jgi:hypothetical protein
MLGRVNYSILIFVSQLYSYSQLNNLDTKAKKPMYPSLRYTLCVTQENVET